MANFDLAFAVTMGHEGGYANNPNDNGGETYKGIARNYWGNWSGWSVIDSIKKTYGKTAAIINKYAGANQTLQASVKQFYSINFWYPLQLQFLNDQQLATNVFDFNVNAGNAARKLQIAANAVLATLSNCSPLSVDGQIGSKTIAAINKLDAKSVYNAFNDERKKYYDAIITKNPSQTEFRNSWYSRIKPYIV